VAHSNRRRLGASPSLLTSSLPRRSAENSWRASSLCKHPPRTRSCRCVVETRVHAPRRAREQRSRRLKENPAGLCASMVAVAPKAAAAVGAGSRDCDLGRCFNFSCENMWQYKRALEATLMVTRLEAVWCAPTHHSAQTRGPRGSGAASPRAAAVHTSPGRLEPHKPLCCIGVGPLQNFLKHPTHKGWKFWRSSLFSMGGIGGDRGVQRRGGCRQGSIEWRPCAASLAVWLATPWPVSRGASHCGSSNKHGAAAAVLWWGRFERRR
jgi:hypothetical protein